MARTYRWSDSDSHNEQTHAKRTLNRQRRARQAILRNPQASVVDRLVIDADANWAQS